MIHKWLVGDRLNKAGKRIARRILTTCWASFITFLNSELTGNRSALDSSGLSNIFRSSNLSNRKKQSSSRVALVIECLQKGITLSGTLELHNHCGEMLEPLTSVICPDSITKRHKSSTDRKYNLVHLIYIEDILKNGLELASQSQDCWKYVMRCVTFVLQMEGQRNENGAKSRPISASKPATKRKKSSDDLDLNFDSPTDDQPSLWVSHNLFFAWQILKRILYYRSQSTFALPPGFDHEQEDKGLRECFSQHLAVKDKPTILTPAEVATANASLLNRIDK